LVRLERRLGMLPQPSVSALRHALAYALDLAGVE
jgi:hypothetical protein